MLRGIKIHCIFAEIFKPQRHEENRQRHPF